MENSKSEQFLNEFQSEYITSEELGEMLGDKKTEINKNRTSLNRIALNIAIQKGKYKNRFKIFDPYYLWNREDVISQISHPEKPIENKADQFLSEFNEKYIISPEICKTLKTHRGLIAWAIKKNHLPNGFQIPVSKYWVWNRSDIEPYVNNWKKSLQKKRKIRKKKDV